MTTDLAKPDQATALLLERVVIGGDLSKLTPTERMQYYNVVCQSVGLNPFTQPFMYVFLQGKMTLYARKEATEQLRQIHGVSVTKLERDMHALADEELYTVTAYGRNAKGREDSALGAMSLAGMRGQDRANAMMKAETKAKRRLTLSLCGLGMLDESEVEIPPTAVTATEKVIAQAPVMIETGPTTIQAPMTTTIQAPMTHETPVLFATPEADRAGLVQRARIAMARCNKPRVAKLKEVWLGDQNADLDTGDLAALVPFVREVEETKL